MDFDLMTRPQVHDAMLAADRERARIAYAGLVATDWDGHGTRAMRKIARYQQRPEYREADARFQALCEELRRRDGDSLVRDRHGRKIGLV